VLTSPRIFAASALLAALALLSALPAAPAGGDERPAAPSDRKTKADPTPPDAFVAVPPDADQKLKEENERLKALLDPEKAAPSKCLAEGRVEGNYALLTLTFEFVTERRFATLPLACQQGIAANVVLDGRTPAFRSEPKGFVAQIDRPGEHKLTLVLTVPLAVRGSVRTLELDLPRSPVTRLSLALPPAVKDVRVGDKAATDTLLTQRAQGQRGVLLEGDLGAVDKLLLSWKGATPNANGPLLMAAEGVIKVEVNEQAQLSATAALTLKTLSGQTDRWQVLTPPNAELKVAPRDEARVKSVESAAQSFALLWTVTLKEAGADPLGVVVTVPPRPLPGDGTRTPIGPFAVPKAVDQHGTLTVTNSAPDRQLQFFRNGSTRGDGRSDNTFTYTTVPLPDSPDGPGALSLLDVEARQRVGLVETQVTHQLRLPRQEGDARRFWYVLTTIRATQKREGAKELVVALPPGCRYVPPPPGEPASLPPPLDPNGPAVAPAASDQEQRLTYAFLPGAGDWKPFTISFRARYTHEAEEDVTQTLGLPLPRGTAPPPDERHDAPPPITVSVPDDLELTVPDHGNAAFVPVRRAPQEQAWRPDPAADRADALTVSWRRYQPEVRVSSVANVFLTPGKAHVVQELRLNLPRAAAESNGVKLTFGAAGRAAAVNLSVREGSPVGPAPGGVVRPVRSDHPDEWRLALEYDVPLTEGGGAVPLAVPEGVTSAETRVRVWAETGTPPQAEGDDWAETPVEEVRGEPRLPVLVLRSTRRQPALALRLAAAAAPPGVSVLADRALVRVTVHDNGTQQYRVGVRLLQVFGPYLDVELPDAVLRLGPEFRLDGVQVDAEAVDEKSGRGSPTGRVARLRLPPSPVREGAVLEIAYQLRPDGDRFRTGLHPPALRGEAAPVPTRWRVTLPSGWVALGPEAGLGVRRSWARRGLLPALAPADGAADLERWLAGRDVRVEDEGPASQVCFRPGLGPLTLTHVPQQYWLLGCSLAAILFGLGVYLLLRKTLRGRAAVLAWTVLAAVAVAAVATALFLPTAAAALLYGCQPGLLVLAGGGLVLWLLHERARRRLVFVPSFSRARHGSSLLRPPTPRPSAEPSTVDLPDGVGSQASATPAGNEP
jgi:hypothetical protein